MGHLNPTSARRIRPAEAERVLIIGGGILTVPLIERARTRGLETIVFDGSPSAPGLRIAHLAAVVSTKDPEHAVRQARRLHELQPIHGVVTAGADVETTVAAVATALGLPGISRETAILCNDKAAMRRRLAEAGIAQPDFAEVKSPDDALRHLDALGLPVIVKPLDNCGSRGVRRIDCREELAAAVTTAISLSSTRTALLEEFVEGTTHTVETIVHESRVHVCSVIDTVHGFAPYAVELEHHNPTRRSAADRQAMVDSTIAALRTIGVRQGPAKVDFLFSATGPQVMEMTARLSGGFHCQQTTPLAHGTDNLNAALDTCLGRPPRTRDWCPRFDRAAICRALFPQPGRITAVTGLEEARRLPGIAAVHALAGVGDRIPEYRSSADRRFFVIASGNDVRECEDRLDRACRTLRIETTPGDPASDGR